MRIREITLGVHGHGSLRRSIHTSSRYISDVTIRILDRVVMLEHRATGWLGPQRCIPVKVLCPLLSITSIGSSAQIHRHSAPWVNRTRSEEQVRPRTEGRPGSPPPRPQNVTLFTPRCLCARTFVDRLNDCRWRYYSIRHGASSTSLASVTPMIPLVSR